jgi:HK97 family phage prohead protease
MPATISGYAALFDVETIIAGLFRERIQRGSFAAALRRDDVRGAFNHSPDHVLGRMKAGTLQLAEDAKGLRYTITVNESDPDAVGIHARIARGDVSGSSFWFGVQNPDTDEEWTRDDPKKLPLRTLKRLQLIDVGPVSYPAYPTTTASAARTDTSIAEREWARLQIELAKAKAWVDPTLR